MRIETNEDLISRNKRIATGLFIFSLIVLIFGFFAANGQIFGFDFLETFGEAFYSLVMPLVLLVGFITTIISVRLTNLWVRQPRPEDAIQEGLKGISNKAVLYNYLHLPARHVLIAPQGVFAIATRYQDGRFTVKNNRWKTHRSAFGAILNLFRMDTLGNPSLDAQIAADHIEEIIEEFAPDVKVQPLVIFVDPRARLEIEETEVPVMYAFAKVKERGGKDIKLSPNLKDYMREVASEERPTLNADQIKQFEEATIEWEFDGE